VHDDDLFSPTLVGLRRHAPEPGERPWRLTTQLYVSVFGGPIAAGLIGYENGKRLGLPVGRRLAIVGIAFAALLGVAVAASAIGSESTGPLQLSSMVAGVAAYLPIRELQKDADLRYRAGRNTDASYDSLWRLGIGAVVVGFVFTAIVMAVATA
jgi:hypothetical protein